MELFRLWDSKEYGKIKLSVLVRNFIGLGLASNEEEAFDVSTIKILFLQFFKYVLKQNEDDFNGNIKDREVMLEEFVAMFKSKEYEQKILDVLN